MNKNIKFTSFQKNVIAVLLIVFILLIGGITYAYFRTQGSSAEQTITTANLGVVFNDDTPIVNANDIIPISEDEIPTKATKKVFKISKSNNSPDMYANIRLIDIVIPDELKSFDFNWALYKDNIKLTTGSFSSLGDDSNIVLATNQFINSNLLTYSLYIWINETDKDQNSMMNKTFKAKIEVNGSDKKSNTLTTNILKESLNTDPNFYVDTDKGLYVQKDDSQKSEFGFPTYYYRGSVENNYVQFGNYTTDTINDIYNGSSSTNTTVAKAGDPILWRIIRINEDGSIKLISEHSVSTNVEYNISNLLLYNQSNAENVVNTWYTDQTNIASSSSLNSKIIIGNYCNDVSSNNKGANERIYKKKNPIFTCPSDGILINSKIGMISADEMMYAGSLYLQALEENITYLNNNTRFWSLTPGSNSNYYGIMHWDPTNKRIDYFPTNGKAASIRAVINIKADTIVKGEGTKSSPYIIK